MTEAIINAATDKLMRTAKDPVRTRVNIILGLILMGTGGAAAFLWKAASEHQKSIAHETAQDGRIDENTADIRRNLEAILDLSILSVHQGRYQAKVWRAIAPDEALIPERPAALVQIEDRFMKMSLR
jgi:hypothetical protein